MDFPFLNTRLRYSCWATLFRYLPWLIHRSAVSSKSGPTMGVAATTHDHNRLSSVPYYRLSRLARLYPPPITRVSLCVWSCDDDDDGDGVFPVGEEGVNDLVVSSRW